MIARQDISELEPAELEAALGAEPYHARQIYRWIYRRHATEFSGMTDLSRTLRAQLAEQFKISTPVVRQTDRSVDGTVKLLLGLTDDQQVESVFIPDTPGPAFCISTQAGCAMRCGFCLTGKMGLNRNLTAGEIAGQVRVLAHTLDLTDRRFNIVLMGMGEPLHNYDQTMKALRILTSSFGLAVPPRRITLSTIGVLPALERLATEPVMPNLAVSLHATTDELRDRLVPINRRYGLVDLIAACRRLPTKRRRRITFEYVLLRGVNDSMADAERLTTLLAGMRTKVNLIPLNEAAGLVYRRPSDAQVDRFARALAERGVTVSVRKSRGRDIRAACGQLTVEASQLSSAQRMADAPGAPGNLLRNIESD
jgi:23S rRNA (adenine2503-C2)-methyltransferase